MKFLALSFLTFAALSFAAEPTPADRSLKICVAADASPEVRAAAEKVLSAVNSHPLLGVLANGHAPPALTDSRALNIAAAKERGFDHLVLIGLPDDPLVHSAWQREARVRAEGGLYIFGFGHLLGDIGYIESDRNPFLHSRFIERAPYETEVVTLTGSTTKGVVLAVEAFLQQSLVNGVVANPGWTRPESNLLQRDPLAPDFKLPDCLPEHLGEWTRIGFTQSAEDEYRGVLADTGVTPLEIWRAKYYRPGVWDGVAAAAAMANYSAGLHRRAPGNTLWAARFISAAEAQASAPKIAEAANLKKVGDQWQGDQPPFSSEKTSPGPLTLYQQDVWLILSTVPAH